MSTQTIDLNALRNVKFNNKDIVRLIFNGEVIWKKVPIISFLVRQTSETSGSQLLYGNTIRVKSNEGIKYKLGDSNWITLEKTDDNTYDIIFADANELTSLMIQGNINSIYGISNSVIESGGTEIRVVPDIMITDFGNSTNEITLGNYCLNFSIYPSDRTNFNIPSNVVKIAKNCFYTSVGSNPRYNFSLTGLGAIKSIDAQQYALFTNTTSGGTITYTFSSAAPETYDNLIQCIEGVIYSKTEEYTSPETRSITLSSNVKYLANSVFSKAKLSNIILNEGLEKIGDSALLDVPVLTDLVIPSTVKEIGKLAFGYESLNLSLANVTFNQPRDMYVKLPIAGGEGMLYRKSSTAMTINTDNITIANYDYNSDGVTATLKHLDGSGWDKTVTPTVTIDGDTITISGENISKSKIEAQVGNITSSELTAPRDFIIKETSSTTISILDFFNGYTYGSTDTPIKIRSKTEGENYIYSDAVKVTYTNPLTLSIDTDYNLIVSGYEGDNYKVILEPKASRELDYYSEYTYETTNPNINIVNIFGTFNFIDNTTYTVGVYAYKSNKMTLYKTTTFKYNPTTTES